MENIIEFNDVQKYYNAERGIFFSPRDVIKAVDGVTFSCPRGKTFGLVGESGCGKSTVAKLAIGILRPDRGQIKITGTKDMVFQDPYSSLNPGMTVLDIVGEPLLVRGMNKREREEKISQVLSRVGLDWVYCGRKYPHQFSGGERQRIAIARALVNEPSVIILDEPVSSLDVSIQAEILNLLKDLQEALDLTYLFISHDLRVVEFMSDTVGVMKDGKLVEVSPKEEIYMSPRHPYTKHLLSSIPSF